MEGWPRWTAFRRHQDLSHSSAHGSQRLWTLRFSALCSEAEVIDEIPDPARLRDEIICKTARAMAEVEGNRYWKDGGDPTEAQTEAGYGLDAP